MAGDFELDPASDLETLGVDRPFTPGDLDAIDERLGIADLAPALEGHR